MRFPVTICLASATLLLTTSLSAQTRLVGDINGIQGTWFSRALVTTVCGTSNSLNIIPFRGEVILTLGGSLIFCTRILMC